jgi:dsRNA-specific ribonuclease
VNTLASTIINQKLQNEPSKKTIVKQLNGGKTNLYFITDHAFWSDNLKPIMKDGYSFELFDILEKESFRFPNRKIPKGNSRANKLGETGCDMNTVVGILGYKFFKKSPGESVLDPTHVIAAILEWAGLVRNMRGYIQFLSSELTEDKQMDNLIYQIKEKIGMDIGFINKTYLNEALTIAAYESIAQQGVIDNIQEKLLPPPNKSLASIGDKALKLLRAVPQYKNRASAYQIENNTQSKEKDEDLKRVSQILSLLKFTHKTVNNQVSFNVTNLRSKAIQARLVEAIIGAIFLTLHDTLGEYGILLDFINKTVDQ